MHNNVPPRPSWIYGPETKSVRRRRAVILSTATVAALSLLAILTGCGPDSKQDPPPVPLARTSVIAPPQVPQTAGTGVSVTLYDIGTVVPVDVARLPHVDCWYEVNNKDIDSVPGGPKVVEVKAICP